MNYLVSVTAAFDADDPQQAAEQMREWVIEHSSARGINGFGCEVSDGERRWLVDADGYTTET